MASLTDKFTFVGERGTLTTLQPPGKPVGADSMSLHSSINWPTGETKTIFIMREVDPSTGREVPGSYTEWEGLINGTSITELNLLTGTDREYQPGETTQVAIHIASSWANNLVEGLLKVHNPDGSLKDKIIEGKNVVPGSLGPDTLADSAVTPEKLGGLVGNLEVQAGVALCNASPSGATTRVEFPEEFSSPPVVTVSYSSSYGGELLRVGIPGTGDIDTKGFSVHVMRGNTTDTFVTWIAVANRD